MNNLSENYEYKPGSQSKLMPQLENTGRTSTGNGKNGDKEWILYFKQMI